MSEEIPNETNASSMDAAGFGGDFAPLLVDANSFPESTTNNAPSYIDTVIETALFEPAQALFAQEGVSPTEMERVISEVREIFDDDELSEKFLRDPVFAKRILEGEPFRPHSLFDAIREIGVKDPDSAAEMISHLHDNGRITSMYKEGDVTFEDGPKESAQQMRIDRLLFLALNKSGFRDGELEKENGEERAIERAIEYVNTLRVACGVTPIGLSKDDYRVMPQGSLGIGTLGVADVGDEETRVVRSPSILAFLASAVHESVHLASDIQMTYQEGDDLEYASKQKVGTAERENKDLGATKLAWLEEALTEELAARFIRNLGEDDPDYGEAVRKKNLLLKKYRGQSDELQFTQGVLKPEEPHDVFLDEEGAPKFAMSGYQPYREEFRELAADIYKRNPGVFEGRTEEEAREQVFALLVKGKFTGNMIPFALLYDAAFGKDAYGRAMKEDPSRLRFAFSREIYHKEPTNLRVYKDENFPGSVIVREGDTGYALRRNSQGEIEGNFIKYLPNGAIGPVYQLHAKDIEELNQRGIVDLAMFDHVESGESTNYEKSNISSQK